MQRIWKFSGRSGVQFDNPVALIASLWVLNWKGVYRGYIWEVFLGDVCPYEDGLKIDLQVGDQTFKHSTANTRHPATLNQTTNYTLKLNLLNREQI